MTRIYNETLVFPHYQFNILTISFFDSISQRGPEYHTSVKTPQ